MPPEALEEARAWMSKATRDLQAAQYLAQSEEPLLDIVVYHCQQAVEKALKGYLTSQGSPFTKTHALVPLVEQAADLDADFNSLLDAAEYLSPFATRFRYPGELLAPEEEEAEEALTIAAEAVRFVQDRIPEDAGSGGLSPNEG